MPKFNKGLQYLNYKWKKKSYKMIYMGFRNSTIVTFDLEYVQADYLSYQIETITKAVISESYKSKNNSL